MAKRWTTNQGRATGAHDLRRVQGNQTAERVCVGMVGSRLSSGAIRALAGDSGSDQRRDALPWAL